MGGRGRRGQTEGIKEKSKWPAKRLETQEIALGSWAPSGSRENRENFERVGAAYHEEGVSSLPQLERSRIRGTTHKSGVSPTKFSLL